MLPLILGLLWLVACGLLLVGIYNYSGVPPEWMRAGGLLFAGLGIAPLALWLAYQRTQSLSSQTDNETARRITDAFSKAVELLGHADVAVRQGGIYALGRLASENESEHPKIMDIVAAYVRDKSGVPDDYDFVRNPGLFLEEGSPPASIDVEAAIAVLRDRNTRFDRKVPRDRHRFDLSNCCLLNVDLARMDLSQVNLSDCIFLKCLFDEADLTDASMVGATFLEADLEGANLQNTDLSGADLREVTAGTLTQVQLDAADGSKHTQLPPGLQTPAHWG